jgi:hypothetical protein
MATSHNKKRSCFIQESALVGHLTVYLTTEISILTYIALYLKSGPYSSSWKEPDFFFRANGHILPTLAVESGWSEEKGQLHKGMDLLLIGGNSSTRVVIIVKWIKLTGGSVSGTVELFIRDRNGMPTLQQSEVCPKYMLVSHAYYPLCRLSSRVLQLPRTSGSEEGTFLGQRCCQAVMATTCFTSMSRNYVIRPPESSVSWILFPLRSKLGINTFPCIVNGEFRECRKKLLILKKPLIDVATTRQRFMQLRIRRTQNAL